MYENVELLKKDLKRFQLPLKGKKELEALFPYVQNSQIVLCASGNGPYDAGKDCWFVLTDTNVFIVLKASMMGAPSVIAVSLRDIDAAIEDRGMLLSKLTLTTKACAKVDWEDDRIENGNIRNYRIGRDRIGNSRIGTLKEDVSFSNASDAAKFVSGYKEISGPEYWKDEDGRCLRDLRDHSKLIQYKTMRDEGFPV